VKTTIRDTAALAALRPADLTAYLRTTGWQPVGATDRHSVWAKRTGNDEYEASIPARRTLADYATRIGELLRTLEAAEGRSQLAIYADLQLSSSDVVRLRVIDDDLSDGTVPINDGVALVDRARDMVLAAACAAVRPRPRYHSRHPDQANQFLDGVRLGQTEHGSFVLTVISRVAPSLGEDTGVLLDEPFERRAVISLANGIAAALTAAESSSVDNAFGPFQDAVSAGVSANLCEAIVGVVGGVEHNRSLEVRFSWARSRPAPDGVPERIFLPGDVMPVLDQASRIWKQRSPLDEYEFIGTVVKLARPDAAEEGRVTLFGPVEDQQRHVTVVLDPQDYSVATRAHDERSPVTVTGDLGRAGNGTYVLNNPRGFQLLPP
jgi:hypothetical protein